MNRHERTLVQIGTVLLVGMTVLRISHGISASMAQALLIFGGLFIVSGIARYNKRLKTANHALQGRPQDQSAPR